MLSAWLRLFSDFYLKKMAGLTGKPDNNQEKGSAGVVQGI